MPGLGSGVGGRGPAAAAAAKRYTMRRPLSVASVAVQTVRRRQWRRRRRRAVSHASGEVVHAVSLFDKCKYFLSVQ